MSVAQRLERLEQSLTNTGKGAFSSETQRQVLAMSREDEVFVDLLRLTAHIEDMPSAQMDRLWGCGVQARAIVEELDIRTAMAGRGKHEAVERLHDAAHERIQRAITERLGADTAVHIFKSTQLRRPCRSRTNRFTAQSAAPASVPSTSTMFSSDRRVSFVSE